jgi:predicted kinase
MRDLFLIRGLPGSGKSTLAKTLAEGIRSEIHEADSFFMVYRDEETGYIVNRHQYDGTYEFDAKLLTNAHAECLNSARHSMQLGIPRVIVANTFTQEWEMQAYFEAAGYYNYTVFCLIVENRHAGKSVHGVGEETIEKMKNRFSINLS